jgi:hypothetical protein
MMNNINWVQTSDLNLNLLTRGSDDLTHEENISGIRVTKLSKNNIKFSGTIIQMFRDTFCVI